jgi:hypothetical protein
MAISELISKPKALTNRDKIVTSKAHGCEFSIFVYSGDNGSHQAEGDCLKA